MTGLDYLEAEDPLGDKDDITRLDRHVSAATGTNILEVDVNALVGAAGAADNVSAFKVCKVRSTA
jgi:hypothetical protein